MLNRSSEKESKKKRIKNMTLDKNARIILVGAVVFGLLIALHLAKSGCNNVTVFDISDFEANHMHYLKALIRPMLV